MLRACLTFVSFSLSTQLITLQCSLIKGIFQLRYEPHEKFICSLSPILTNITIDLGPCDISFSSDMAKKGHNSNSNAVV